VNSGKINWQYRSNLPIYGGALATASNLLFAGEMNGNFDAFDARTGKKLWDYYMGIGVCSSPITYRVNGAQYVAVSGAGCARAGDVGQLVQPQYGDTIAIFALPRE
jgi:glucose dehydrogenase